HLQVDGSVESEEETPEYLGSVARRMQGGRVVNKLPKKARFLTEGCLFLGLSLTAEQGLGSKTKV
ncbi:MAG TPA: hypothetical protein DIV54_02825, partial [Verrucomicrobiales bacterium]|nr:hypothetical protein [Verrucomicrobiales bacterium]